MVFISSDEHSFLAIMGFSIVMRRVRKVNRNQTALPRILRADWPAQTLGRLRLHLPIQDPSPSHRNFHTTFPPLLQDQVRIHHHTMRTIH